MRTLLFFLVFLLVAALPAAAQSIENIRPHCVGPDGRLLICGADFADDPVVTIGGVDAVVLRSAPTKILVRVPADAPTGDAVVNADGATATVEVLAAGAPVVAHISSNTATVGQLLVVIGRHLNGADAVFVDDAGAAVATAPLRGRGRVGFFRVPDETPVGKYTLEIRNDAGTSGSCSPTVKIIEAGNPALKALAPEGQQPGRSLKATGSDLGPIGFCVAHWTDADGTSLIAGGFANGYDTVYTYVPIFAVPGTSYDVHIEFADGSSTEESGLLAYMVGQPPDPEIKSLQFEAGPAGSPLGIRGVGFFPSSGNAFGLLADAQRLPLVEFTRDGVAHEARILFGGPGHGDEGDFLVVRVPEVKDGVYDVTVTVGDKMSNAVAFSVKELPLTVTSMRPNRVKSDGRVFPVRITGSGFGAGADGTDIAVTWARDGTDPVKPLAGLLLFRNDREMLVVPPGGRHDRLPAGSYTVRVTRHPGTDHEQSVIAGTYTVE